MIIGILIYSKTGNTLKVAEEVKKQLEKEGKTAIIERITISSKSPNSPSPLRLQNIPDLSKYDKLIIGSTINGFSLCIPMKKYLKHHADIKGKDVNCYVTQYVRHPHKSDSKGIRQIIDLCREKGGKVRQNYIINWSSNKRDEQIDEAVRRLARI